MCEVVALAACATALRPRKRGLALRKRAAVLVGLGVLLVDLHR